MSEKYQVLARKYRPQTFAEVVGQQAAVTTLKNAIRFQKIAHAYLFCGTRGVGKTTLARLFAKALNCQSPTNDLEPCGSCSSCMDTTSGQSLDVIEIDGASNRGIDDIRQINETVGYAPSHGRYKIYIIDEVHMLTKEAFNALLKTLEEPPLSAKFFFATTEPHKVLPTIISRCQRFDLSRIAPDQISSKLQQIATDLSRTVDPDALQLIASFADGSLRDAESLFDQILCFANSHISAATVRQSLGLVPQELFFALDEAFSNYNLGYAFELVDQLFQTGKDLAHFLEQLVEHYRTLTLIRTLGEKKEHSSYLPSARLYTQQQCLHILDLLIQAESSFQKSPFPRITLESILLQIIRSKHRIPVEAIVRKLTESAPELAISRQQEPFAKVDPVSSSIEKTVERTIDTGEAKEASPAEARVETKYETDPSDPTAQQQISIETGKTPENSSIEKLAGEKQDPAAPLQEASALSIEASAEKIQIDPLAQKIIEANSSAELCMQPTSNIAAEAYVEKPPAKTENLVLKPAPFQPSLKKKTEEAKEDLPKTSGAGTAPQSVKPAEESLLKSETPSKKPAASSKPAPAKTDLPLSGKHPAAYDTLLRFASIELEGTVKT